MAARRNRNPGPDPIDEFAQTGDYMPYANPQDYDDEGLYAAEPEDPE